MSAPFKIKKRPFAVEPLTGLMLPDGIFDSAIRRFLISAYVVNSSDHPLCRFWARIHDNADYTVTGRREIHPRSGLAPGAATLLQWEVTFRGATPGKKTLDIEFGGISTAENGEDLFWDGFASTTYFLSSTSYDPATGA